MRSLRAAAVQMVSSTDPETNISTMKRLVREAAEQGADWVLLPEYWPLMGRKDTDKLAFAEPLVNGRFDETRYARFSETRCARFQTTSSQSSSTYSLTSIPASRMASFASRILTSPKWKILAANTASAFPSLIPSTKC
mgnify:CR=1 FL=1